MDLCQATFRSFFVQWLAKIASHQPQLKPLTLVTSRNGDRKAMYSIRITSRPLTRKMKWNQLSQFWRTSTKVMPIEKT